MTWIRKCTIPTKNSHALENANYSGFASEALNFLLPLHGRVNLGVYHSNPDQYSKRYHEELPPEERAIMDEYVDSYFTSFGGTSITHGSPDAIRSMPRDSEFRVARTMFETDRIAPSWVELFKRVDEVWVPSQFNVDTFSRSGVALDKLKIVPGAVDPVLFDPRMVKPLGLENKASYNFLSIFEWQERKAWNVLLGAYLREFTCNDDVCLWLRSSKASHIMTKLKGGESLPEQIESYGRELGLNISRLPRIEILSDPLPLLEMPSLYKAMDCLVGISRGEGWGRPQHEAMMMGLPVIATNWSGNTEFMTNNTAYLLDHELTETANLEPAQAHYQGHLWAEPFEEHLRQLMREVFANPKAARLTGQRARAHVKKHFSREAVAELVINRLQAIEAKLTGTKPIIAPQPIETEKAEGKFVVAWEGSFLDYGSLSHVNRSITTELREQPGIDLACIQKTAGMTPEMPNALADFTQNMASEASTETQVTVRHSWPPIWEKPSHGKWVNIQPWEFGVLPAEWVREMENLDEAWVPSSYVRDCYIDSGVPADKVQVIPNGIDEKIFRPDAPALPIKTDKRYKFLFVGGTIGRKGPDILLNTYLETFTADDDVCLVIKDFGGKTFYAGKTLAEVIEQAQAQPNAPEIVYIDDDLPPEQVAGLYTACDCLVHPYRGEGFGLPVLEAMASGTPVVASDIPVLREVGDTCATYADPQDPISFRNVIQEALSNPRPTRSQLQKNATRYSWDDNVQKIIDKVNALS